MRNVLESIDTSQMQVVALMDCVDVAEEAENGFAWNGEHDHDEHEDIEYDEHIWTSPKNAILMANAIGKAMQAADADHQKQNQTRTNAYIQKKHTQQNNNTQERTPTTHLWNKIQKIQQ